MDYFEKVSELHRSAKYKFVSSNEIGKVREEINEINKSLIAVKETMQVHLVAAISKGKI